MLLPSLKVAVVTIFLGLLFSPLTTKAFAQEIPAQCQVTLPSSGQFQPTNIALSGPIGSYAHKKKVFLYGSEKLSVVLPADGTWKTLFDSKYPKFAYEGMLPWFRVNPSFAGNDGSLTVTLRQLDLRKDAPLSQDSNLQGSRLELVPFDNSDTMLKAAIKIPKLGCWQITGHYKDQDLSFVVWVQVVQSQLHPYVPQGAVGSPYR